MVLCMLEPLGGSSVVKSVKFLDVDERDCVTNRVS